NRLPLGGVAQTAPIEFDGEETTIATTVHPQADLRSITPDYFRTMQIPVISGRGFVEADGADAPLVGVIDERIARTYFKDRDPLGRRCRPTVPGQPWTTIVGVVGHIHHDRLDDDGRPQVYWSYRQNTQDRMAIVVRTRSGPDAFGRELAA